MKVIWLKPVDVHVDENCHDRSVLNRKINILIYFNLWWKKIGVVNLVYITRMEKMFKKISPIFNRLVAFDTHDYSMHGLPNSINFPRNNPRKSLILYYHTKEQRPKSLSRTNKPHSVL